MVCIVVRWRSVMRGAMICLLLCGAWWRVQLPLALRATVARQGEGPGLEVVINNIFALRSLAVLRGDPKPLRDLYDQSVATGRWAFEHEKRRIEYITAWAEKRGVRFVEATAEGRLVRSEKRDGSLWLYVIQSAGYGYVYLDDADETVNRFGVGTRHVMQLTQVAGSWVVSRDWYTDPLDEDTLIPEVTPATADRSAPVWATPLAVMRQSGPNDVVATAAAPLSVLALRSSYNRDAAVEYANTYCGAAVGCGNNRRYNPDYRDYTGLGGDCTNFASQVLADPAAGGLPSDGAWYYRKGHGGGGGSTAWVKATQFAHHLASSAMARRLGRGPYHKAAEPTPGRPWGLLSVLEPGDVIAYEEKGRVVHFAVITGRDSKGVPVVNSHTADRYRVPWDLGWDQQTVFWLFRMVD